MQVSYVIKFFDSKLGDHRIKVVLQVVEFVDVGIIFKETSKDFFRQVVNRNIRMLLLQASKYGRGQYYVANRRKSDDQHLHLNQKLNVKKAHQTSLAK